MTYTTKYNYCAINLQAQKAPLNKEPLLIRPLSFWIRLIATLGIRFKKLLIEGRHFRF